VKFEAAVGLQKFRQTRPPVTRSKSACAGQRGIPMREVRALAIPHVKLIRTRRFSDEGDYFCQTYQHPAFAARGIRQSFVRDDQFGADRNGSRFALSAATICTVKLVRVLNGRHSTLLSVFKGGSSKRRQATSSIWRARLGPRRASAKCSPAPLLSPSSTRLLAEPRH
jgi:hypothetical protein